MLNVLSAAVRHTRGARPAAPAQDPMSRLPFIIVALHAYVGARLLPDLPWGMTGMLAGAAVLAASAWLIPFGFSARRRASGPAQPRLMWAGLLAMGAFSTLFVLTALRDAALLIAMTIVAWAGVDLPIGAIARDTAVTVPLLTLLITALGYVNARRVARVRDVDVPIVALPAALHGFTIVQISDVHVGPTIGRDYLEAIVASVNALDADVVAITGDLVDGSVAPAWRCIPSRSRVSTSRHGTYLRHGQSRVLLRRARMDDRIATAGSRRSRQ